MKILLRKSFVLALGALVLDSSAAQPAASGSFTLVGPMSQFRKLHTATLLSNGKVLVAGGTPFADAATSEIYDPATENWTNSGALNTGREFHTATLLQDGRVVVTGGQTANQVLARTEVYDPANGRWTKNRDPIPARVASRLSVNPRLQFTKTSTRRKAARLTGSTRK